MQRNQTIELKTSLDVVRIRKTGHAISRILKRLEDAIRPGATTSSLALRADLLLGDESIEPSLRGYRNYPSSICTSVNTVAVHGVPGDYVLEDGDVITVDLTGASNGWHADSAWTFVVGTASADLRRLLRASWLATRAGIDAARAGSRFGDVGAAIEATAAKYGCSVLDRFVGHGIGRAIHEDPMVLHTGEPGTGSPIVPGMVFTVEPILALGASEVFTLDDGWSMVTCDHSLCAQFEHTVAVFGSRTEVLTWDGPPDELSTDYPAW